MDREHTSSGALCAPNPGTPSLDQRNLAVPSSGAEEGLGDAPPLRLSECGVSSYNP